MGTARRLQAATAALRKGVDALRFAAPITHVYNPLDYAAKPHARYLRQYGDSTKRVVFLGMNPGPFGMAQTGIPFGEVEHVRDWLGLEAPVGKPANENPKRPVEGFACRRSEVSGARLWGAIAAHYATPAAFFREHFIANYCPLVFMEASGRNFTPDKLPTRERADLFAHCDGHLRKLVRILEPEWLVGIGAFAARRAEDTLADMPVRVGQILHPSPANPRANRGWAREVRRQLAQMGLCPGA